MIKTDNKILPNLFPKHIVIEITDMCNLRCPMCWIHGEKGISLGEFKKEVSISEIKRFLKKVKQNGSFVRFTGGEPFMKKDFFGLLEWMKKEGIAIERIATNAQLIDKLWAKRLVDLGIRRITVSIDGSRKVHDKIRGKGTFNRAMEAISFIQQEKEKSKSNTPSVEIVCTVSNMNYEDLDGFYAVGKKLNVKTIIQMLNWTQRDFARDDVIYLKKKLSTLDKTSESFAIDMNELDSKKLSKKVISLMKKAKIEGVDLCVRPVDEKKSIEKWYSSQDDLFFKKSCKVPESILRLSPQGKIVACRYIRYVYGDIDSITKNAWPNKKAQAFIKRIKEDNPLSLCKRCNCFKGYE